MIGLARPLWRNRRGGAGLIVAAALPMLLGAGALAVDLGSVQLETRRLQGIADAAAIAAAADPSRAQALAEASVAAAGWPHPTTIAAQGGRYHVDPTVAVNARFAPGAGAPDAARVTVASRSPTFLARVFGARHVAISRTATAARKRHAAFSIGSRLASVDGGILNAYLSALTGSSVSLSVMDYTALVGSDVDLLALLPLLRTRAGLSAVTFEEILDAHVTTPQLLGTLADALDGQGAGGGAALRALALTVPGGSLSLAALLDAGPFGNHAQGGEGVVRVNTMALVTAMLQLAAADRQVSFDLGAGLPGLSSTRVTLAVGERVRQSPWIAISDAGTPIVRTAQTRAFIDARIAPTSLPGLSGLLSVRLPVFVELAAAEAKVTAIDCPTLAGRGVTLDARTAPGRAALGSVDPARLHDFAAPVTVGTATLVETLLVAVTGSSQVDLGAAEPWQQVRFDQAAIDARAVRTVRSSRAVTGIAASLLAQPSLHARLLGLPIPLDPLLRAVGGLLSGVAPAIDGLLGVVTGAVGVGFGEADLRVTGMRCGTPALVA